MKLITFAVPCYNSAAYMRKCIESILPGGEDIEIIIVDDGSTDDTGRIADEYQEMYPEIVRVVHQQNGGHGEGVNQGLRNATGLYYKVVDSDDWLDADAYCKALKHLRTFSQMEHPVDMMVCNYVYEHVEDDTRHVVHYRRIIPRGQVCSWQDVGWFPPSQYLLMHSVIFRTQILRDAHLELPKHTFYVDNLFVFTPLPLVKSIYYLDVDLYRYFIGRSDQSVAEDNIIRRIDQQLLVTRKIISMYDFSAIKEENRRLYRYMVHYCSIMMTVLSMFLTLSGTEEHLQKRRELWEYLYYLDAKLYRRLRYLTPNVAFVLPGKAGRAMDVAGYRITRRFIKFN